MRLARTCLLAFGLLAAWTTHADEITGRVVSIADGDTITVLDTSNTQHKIRLEGIDAPERGQPFGTRSRQNLSDLVFGKVARVDWHKRDRYGRVVGKVWVTPSELNCMQEPCPKTLDAGRAQLTVGLAWHFKKYEMEQSEQDRLVYAFEEPESRTALGVAAEAELTLPTQI